ncbi:ABC transporter permease [Wukongibacter sp. M2B1]|uniref:ABC transporter permease n=1 Tax=Wukongibacter sp. M2B1 TaxID=3088895 RepID=UPI003D78F44A
MNSEILHRKNNCLKGLRKRLRSVPQIVILLLLSLLIGMFILYPFIMLVMKSFGLSLDGGEFSLEAYKRIIKDRYNYRALNNTIYVASGVTVLTSILGGGLGWIVTRTDYAYKKFTKRLVFLSFIIPSYIIAISWIEFFGRNGYLSRIIYNMFGLSNYKALPYSLEAVILVMSIHLYPLVFMAITNALEKMDFTLEDAAVISGASRLKAVITITLPLMIPSFFSIGLLVFSRTIANFGVPAALALPIGKEVLTTRIYSSLTNLDFELVTSLSIVLVVISGLIFSLSNIALKKRGFITITGNSKKTKEIQLGRYKMPLSICVFVFHTITTIIPLITILTASVLKRWGLSFEIKHLTLNNYLLLFKHKTIVRAFGNSIFYGLMAATIAACIGVCVSYISDKTNVKGKKILEFITAWPMSFPNIVLAVAATLAWMKPPLKLYGTEWIIIVTYISLFIPISIKNISGLMQNQHISLERAARISGASRIKGFMDITFPLIFPGIRSGWILGFLIALREIPMSLLLYSAGQETIGVMLFGIQSNTYGLEMTSTLAIVIIALTAIGNILIKKIGDFKRGGGVNNTGRGYRAG